MDHLRPEIIDNLFKRKSKLKSQQLASVSKEPLKTTSSSQIPTPSKIEIIGHVTEDGEFSEKKDILQVEVERDFGSTTAKINGDFIESVKLEVKKEGTFVNLKRKNGKTDVVKFENRYLYKKKLLKFKGAIDCKRNQFTVFEANLN